VRHRIAALGLLAAACTTDFFLEGGTDGSTGGADTGEPTTNDPATSIGTNSAEGSTGMSTGTSDDPSTTNPSSSESGADPTTESAEESTTHAESTSDTTTGAEASVGETSVAEASAEATTEGGGEGGALDCPEVVGEQEGCEAVPACDWYAEGPCFVDACHPDAEIACDGFPYEVCLEMPLCTWFGMPEKGECSLTPCNELGMEGCVAAPGCEWIAEEPGTCVFVECPACFGVGELDCMENPQCTWFDVAETCAAD